MSAEPRKRTAVESAGDLLATEPDLPRNTQRPGSLTGGTLLVVLRALGGPVWILGLLNEWPSLRAEFALDDETSTAVLAIIVGAVGLWALILAVFGIGLWRGSNLARMLVQCWAALSITAAAIAFFSSSGEITVRATLLTLALDILILLALSSRTARAWTRGRSRRWRAWNSAGSAQ